MPAKELCLTRTAPHPLGSILFSSPSSLVSFYHGRATIQLRGFRCYYRPPTLSCWGNDGSPNAIAGWCATVIAWCSGEVWALLETSSPALLSLRGEIACLQWDHPSYTYLLHIATTAAAAACTPRFYIIYQSFLLSCHILLL